MLFLPFSDDKKGGVPLCVTINLTVEGIQYDLFSGFLSGLEEVRERQVDFSEKLFHRMVDYATVHSDGRVVFTFCNGVEVSTEI